MDLCQQCLCFLIHCLGLSRSFSSKEQVSFNFMAVVGVHSDFGAQENKVCHCFHCFSICLPWSDGTGRHDLSFLNGKTHRVIHYDLCSLLNGNYTSIFLKMQKNTYFKSLRVTRLFAHRKAAQVLPCGSLQYNNTKIKFQKSWREI